MDDMVSLFKTGQREFGARVHEIRDDQWGAPTPDDEWDVAALVEHLIDEARWVAPLLEGMSLVGAGAAVAAMPRMADDRVGAWESAAAAAAAAVSAEGALERTVELSRGPTPASGYIGEMIFDLCVHSWDLGRAIGSSRPLPDELVDAVFQVAKGFGDLSTFGDMFKPAVSVPEHAPLVDRLVAFTGRDPSYSPA
jgi:uncharacterized protein (TIGR03086 family)